MKETILTIVVGLLLTIVSLFIEKCYFEESSCPIDSMNAIASETPRGVKKSLLLILKSVIYIVPLVKVKPNLLVKQS